jgi:hypothetical protein
LKLLADFVADVTIDTSALIPAFSPKEKEKRSQRL